MNVILRRGGGGGAGDGKMFEVTLHWSTYWVRAKFYTYGLKVIEGADGQMKTSHGKRPMDYLQ